MIGHVAVLGNHDWSGRPDAQWLHQMRPNLGGLAATAEILPVRSPLRPFPDLKSQLAAFGVGTPNRAGADALGVAVGDAILQRKGASNETTGDRGDRSTAGRNDMAGDLRSDRPCDTSGLCADADAEHQPASGYALQDTRGARGR